jgi:hypothetical protein
MFSAQFADLALCHLADESLGLWRSLDARWKTELFNNPRMLARREPPLEAEHPNRFYVVLGHKLDSASRVWPAETLVQTSRVYYRPLPIDRLVWACVTSFEEWKALRYRWTSPLSQTQAVDVGSPIAEPVQFFGIVAEPLSAAAEPLLEAAARDAFGVMGIAFMKRIAKDRGIVLPPGASLFTVLFAVIQNIVGCSDQEALAICNGRITTITDLNKKTSSELIALDEGLSFLQRDEKELVEKEKRRCDARGLTSLKIS